MLQKLWFDEEGASMTEYILLIALVGMAVFVAVKLFGGAIENIFKNATKKLENDATF
jgi:Flp pilus assembly pilin Flp